MARQDNAVYYAKRARTAWRAAQHAHGLKAATAHAKMARGYEAKVREHQVEEIIERVVSRWQSHDSDRERQQRIGRGLSPGRC